MTLEVLQHVQQRLAAVVHDLKSPRGQKAARAYLTRIITIKSLEFAWSPQIANPVSPEK